MNPGKFDVETCRELLGDEQARVYEKIGREAAEAMDVVPNILPPEPPPTYWDEVIHAARETLLVAAYLKRKARLERMAKKT